MKKNKISNKSLTIDELLSSPVNKNGFLTNTPTPTENRLFEAMVDKEVAQNDLIKQKIKLQKKMFRWVKRVVSL